MSDLDNLLDATLDDIEDLPSFQPFPIGAHRVTVDLELKKVNDVQNIELTMTAIETIELANADDEPLKEGDSISMLFSTEGEWGPKFFKKATAPIAKALGTGTIRELIEACKSVECMVVTSLRKDKNDPDKFYTDIKELAVV